MSTILKPGQAVRAELSGVTWSVASFLGGGGQGEVYSVHLGREQLALKWYFAESATPAQRKGLEALVSKGPPSDAFLWPLDLASAPNCRGFGYLMPLRDRRFCSGNDLVKRRIEPSFNALATAGFNIAGAFLQLHSHGLAYRDISFGNVFLDPVTGAVSICDNDNVSVDGGGASGVYGTPKFMAPEIVRGEATPSTYTDQYSLAVLLFYLLFMHHPLEGKREADIRCLDAPAMAQLYGTQAVFVADPNDASNRPVRGLHDNFFAFWVLYPQFLKRLFTRAFTVGLKSPAQRIKESEWRQAMVQLRDCIFRCLECSAENFLNVGDGGAAAKQREHCWNCGKPIVRPLALKVGGRVVVLNADTRFYPHHIEAGRLYDFSCVLAELSPHPTRLQVWGIKNLGSVAWKATEASGREIEVLSGRSMELTEGLRIRFGTVEAVIYRP